MVGTSILCPGTVQSMTTRTSTPKATILTRSTGRRRAAIARMSRLNCSCEPNVLVLLSTKSVTSIGTSSYVISLICCATPASDRSKSAAVRPTMGLLPAVTETGTKTARPFARNSGAC
jgi:hypothetical protein